MNHLEDASKKQKHGRARAATQRAAMIAVGDVAEMLNCSTRTVYRLSDSGRMPRPTKLGALVRWPLQSIEQWISDGCPRCEPRRRGVTR